MEVVPQPIPMIPRLPAQTAVADPGVPTLLATPELTGPSTGPLQLTEVDRRPISISTPHPAYPVWARARQLQARVDVEFTVDAQGRVSDVRVRKMEGNERFGGVVKRAVGK